MALNKIRLGDYIELYSEKCNIPNLTVDDVSGINKNKEFFEPSKQVGKDTSNYKIVPHNYFACNLMHVGRDIVLPIALNNSGHDKYVSPAYTVFKLKDQNTLLRRFLFILLNSKEKDRYFWFHCDSSVRDGMDWSAFSNIELEIPSVDIQQKYVNVYESIVKNLKTYGESLDKLKFICDAYIEELRNEYPKEEIGKYLSIRTEKNDSNIYGLEDVKGVSQEKTIISTKADASRNDLSKFIVIYPNDFVYNPRNGIAIGLNNTNEKYIISWNNTAFYINRPDIILPEFLFMFFCRSEWNRKVKFDSWGSSTEVYSFESLGETTVPIPPINIQKAIVNIFNIYDNKIAMINEIQLIKDNICPLLTKGAIIDSQRG